LLNRRLLEFFIFSIPLFALIIFRLGDYAWVWFAVAISYALYLFFNLGVVIKNIRNLKWSYFVFIPCFLIFIIASKYSHKTFGYAFGENNPENFTQSNSPTTQANDTFIIDYWFSEKKLFRGQFVNFNKEDMLLQKRIHGIPGDEVCIMNDAVFINGFFIKKDREFKVIKKDKNMACIKKLTLSENEYFVLGDNFSNSFDSRHFGVVKRQDIVFILAALIRNDEFLDKSLWVRDFVDFY